ncbi:MAG: hypothetical protein LBU51_07170 [Bacteroidales bacterium]|jgi:GT2 family glycosyltransferase|nr:hypothetical protein [Bacteroidales bacterium]
MKQIAVLCVNYHSYKELKQYLNSINNAAILVPDWQIEVMVADNSDRFQQEITTTFPHIKVEIFPFYENLGYLNAIAKVASMKGKDYFLNYQFVIFSNVDISLELDFFEKLTTFPLQEQIGWLAPSIYSKQEKLDKNPSMISRPNLKQINRLIRLYEQPIYFQLYRKLIYPFRRKRRKTDDHHSLIYAGHGSCMIFSGSFIHKITPFQFPTFLFCEEIFLAELLIQHHLTVYYEPSIKVQDLEHINTGNINYKRLCQWHIESLQALKQLFIFD